MEHPADRAAGEATGPPEEAAAVGVSFRLTPQRTAILAAVRAASDHPTARELFRRVRRREPRIGFATVYRTLNLLVEHGEILELQLGDDAVARYDGDTGPHDHVVCRGCAGVADIRLALPASLLAEAARASGYEVDSYDLRFSGRCPACA